MSQYPRGKEPVCPQCQREPIRNRGAQCCGKCNRDPGWHRPPKPVLPTAEAIDRLMPGEYDAAVNVLKAAIGEAQSRYGGPAKTRNQHEGMTTRVIASDFHAPFHDVNAVARMLMQTAGADGITIVGDLMDTYGVSRFVRYRQIPMTQEIAAVKALLEELSSWYPDVEIVEGNHDRARLEKALRARCNDDNLMTALEVLTDGNFSIVRAVAKHLPNVRFSSHEVDGYRVRWFTQIGDVLVTHAEKFSKVPVSAVRQVEDWFVDQDAVLGLQPWRILVQAHTHQLSRTPWRADKLLMESGCLCETQGYMLDPRITGRPQRHGYITLRQKDGITDINGSREWWLDADA